MVASLIPFSAFQAFADTVYTDGDWQYTLDGSNAVITGYLGNAADITVPDTVGGYTVTEIGENAFWGSSIETVSFPDTLTNIDQYAFKGCESLYEVTLPAGIQGIGQYAFYDCTSLDEITIPNKTVDLMDYCFGFVYDGEGASLGNLTMNVPAESTAYYYCDNFGVSYYIMPMEDYIDYIDIENGNVIQLTKYENDPPVYLRFIPESDGTYIFESDYNGDEYDPCVMLYDEYGSLLTSDDDGANDAYGNFRLEYSFTQGETYYFCCTVSGDESVEYGYDVSLNRYSAADAYPVIELDTLTEAVIPDGESYAYFQFTPTVSGTYYFEGFADSDTYGYIYDENMSELASNDDGGSNYNFKVEYQLYAGTTYILGARFYSYNSGSFNVKLYKAPSATSIEFEEGSAVSGFAGFTKTLHLNFLPEGASVESVDFVCADEYVARVTDSDNTYCTIEFVGAGTTTLYARNAGNTLTAQVTITVQEMPVIQLDTLTSAVITNGGDYAYFKFTPTESGTYYFESYANTDTYGYIYDSDLNQISSDDDSGTDNNFKVGYYLEADTTYIYAARYYNSSNTGSFNVKVYKAPAATSVYFTNGSSYSGYIYDSLNLYTDYLPSGCIAESCSFLSSNSSVAEIQDSYDNYCQVRLVGEGTATITATSTNGLAAVYTINCLAPTVLTLDTPASFDLSDGSAMCASFTPSETGRYIFTVTDASNGDYIYKELFSGGSVLSGWSESSYIYDYDLENGTTYLIKVPAGNYNGSFKLTVSKCVAATGVVFETEAGFSDYIGTNTELIAKLAPDNAIPESITFTSSNDSIVSISYDGNYSSTRYYCNIALNAVGTATVTATSESGLSATYTVTVLPYPELTLDTPYTFNLEGGKSAIASFTPSESGTYAFTCSDFSNGYYFYKYLELNGATLTTTYGSSITANLTAGNTYYFKTNNYYGVFKLTVTKLVEATGVTFVTEPGLTAEQFSTASLSAKLIPDNAINQNITFTSGDTSIAEVTDSYKDDETGNYICNLKLKAAGTATITATSESGLTATYDVTVNALPTITLDTPYAMTSTGYDNENAVAFNCTETGTYKLSSSKYCYKEIYEGFNYEFDTYSDSFTFELEAGKTYLFKCRYFNGTNNLTLTKCVAANSLTFEHSTYTGDEYTLATLTTALGPSNAIPEGVTFTSSNTAVAAINGYGSNSDVESYCELKLLSSGTATITATSVSGLTATCTVTVRALPSLTLNSAYTLNSSNNNDMHYVKFTPTISGGYYFNMGDYGYITVNEGFNYYTEGDKSVYVELTAGTTYVIGVNEFVGQNTITVKRAVAATSMSLSQSSISGYAYTSVTLYTALAPANAIPQAATFASSDSSVVQVYNYGDDYCELRLLAPGTATVTATSASGLTATCEITVSEMSTLTLDTPYAVYNESYNDSCYVSFTPSESGGYYFKTASNNYNEIFEGFDGCESQYGSIYCELTAGTTYIVKMSEFSGSNSVTVIKAAPATSLNIIEDTVSGYAYTYKSITAEFAPDNYIPEDVVFSSSDTSVVRINYTYTSNGKKMCTLQLVSAGTATITATSENGLTDTCAVTVLAPIVLTEETLTPVEIVNRNEVCYSFTPSQSGTYFFKISDYSNKNRASVTLQEGFSQLYYSDTDIFSYSLTAGTTYILKTTYRSWYNNTGGSGTYNLIAAKAVPATGITLTDDSLIGFVGTTAQLEVSFEPWNAEAEGYTFSSSDSGVVSVDDSGAVTFASAGTATITVTSDSGFTDTCAVTSRNMKVLTAGVTATAEIGDGVDTDYFIFTAPESGYYVFSSSANKDTYGEIYDSNLVFLDGDDDSGVDNNFRIKREMTAGETYIFSARFYSSDESGSFPVIIEKKAVATGIEIVSAPAKTEYIKGYLNQSFDASGLVIRIHWSDSTVTNYTYDSANRYIDGLPVSVNAFTVGDGNSARFSVSYDGNTAYGNLTLVESPVESIELVYNDCLTYVENTNGYQSSRWNNLTNSSESFFHYYISNVRDIAVKINYKNGTSTVANVGDTVDGINVTYTDTQDNQPWTVGASNSFRINYIDKSVLVPVIVISNGISSLEVVTPTATSFIENSDGHEDEYWDDVNGVYVDFFRYNLWNADFTDAVIRINYLDGTSTTAHIGDTVDGYRISYSDTQYGNPWSVGTNYVTVTYMGETVQMPVQVVETPVAGITVNSSPTYTYIYGDTTYGYTFAEDGVSYYALESFSLAGLSFTVNFKDGTQKSYSYQDIGQDGRIDGYLFGFDSVDYGNGKRGATQPGNVTVNWSYMGAQLSYNAVINENTVASIEILEQPTVSSYKDSFFMEPYGLKVRIHYADSSYTDVTFTRSNTNIDYENMALGGRFSYSVTVNSNEMYFYKFWDGEYAYYKVDYLGKSATLDGHMSDVGVADVSIVTFAADCDGMVLDVCYDDGTSETLTLTKMAEIGAFVDGNEYLVNSSSGMFFTFIAPIRDANNQIIGYWVEGLLPVEYYLNVSFVAGDIDSDGDVDLTDYEIIKAYISGESVTASKLDNADMNNDGAVDAFDLFELDKLINNTLSNKFTYSEIDASTAKITAYNGTDTQLTMPRYYGSHLITTIAQNAFKAKNTLVSVELCDSITTLENYAFQNCSSLKSVTFNNGLEKINYGSFLNCTKLERVVLPNSVTTIGSNAFKGCTSLKYVAVSSGVTSLSGTNIFANCTSLQTVIIPESVTAINANTFTGCNLSILTIYGKAGSYAETFANANGINFVAM